MSNRIKPRLQYVVVVENSFGAYEYLDVEWSLWRLFQDCASHFDSLREARQAAWDIPGAFVATVLAD
jgi:hypothetical protein